jgi:hypothetical protein
MVVPASKSIVRGQANKTCRYANEAGSIRGVAEIYYRCGSASLPQRLDVGANRYVIPIL